MVDHGLYARQTLAHSFGLDKEAEQKRYPALRPAWGHEWLAKVADDVEESVPALSGLFNAVWGEKPKVENHEPTWWAEHRPRPHRGKSADPREAEKKTKAIQAQQAAEAAAAAGAAAAAEEAAAEAAGDKQAEQAVKELDFATAETQKRRLSFFGRPAHKFRLNQLQSEIERKSHENQAVLWAHLWSDANSEYEMQEEINQTERRKKETAASSAASYRAEETGARAAVAGLKPLGAALKSAMRDAQAAAERYRELAEEQEALARKAKIAEDLSFELMQRVRNRLHNTTRLVHVKFAGLTGGEKQKQEDEKRRICQAQIKGEKFKAKAQFENCAKIETMTLKALNAEAAMLEEFESHWKIRLSKVAGGSPAYFRIQAQIDEFDLRLDVVKMEKRMYAPMYLRRAPTSKKNPHGANTRERLVYDTFEEADFLENIPVTKPIKWIYEQQHAKDGKVGLGQGAVGPVLKFRKRIVQTLGAKEHEDIDELKDLPEEACDSLYENPIKLIADFAENVGPLGFFLSRKQKDAGKKTPETELKKEIFAEIWGQDPRHKVEVNKMLYIVRLRHRPTFKWCCQWIIDDEDAKKCKIQRSYSLGPQKHPFVHSKAPAWHENDAPNNIIDSASGLPRRFARICRWFLDEGGWVEKGQELVSFRVYEPELMHPKKNPNGRFPPNYPRWDDSSEKAKIEAAKAKIDKAIEFLVAGGAFEWRDDEKEDDEDNPREGREHYIKAIKTDRKYVEKPKILVLKSPSQGLLTGLLRDPDSKILSFDNLAMFDLGETKIDTKSKQRVPAYENMILPVSEWPTELFG